MTLYTKTDIAEKLSVSYSRVVKTVNDLNMKGQKAEGRSYNHQLYTKEQVEQIRQALITVEDTKAPVQTSAEELKALHPLVTDERFLKDGFFPNVIPNCFEE